MRKFQISSTGAAKHKISGIQVAEDLYKELGELENYDPGVSDYEAELKQALHGLKLSQEKVDKFFEKGADDVKSKTKVADFNTWMEGDGKDMDGKALDTVDGYVFLTSIMTFFCLF